jgi:hypothetical protein
MKAMTSLIKIVRQSRHSGRLRSEEKSLKQVRETGYIT